MAKLKRPRDPMQLAKLVIDMATGEIPNDSPKGRWKRARRITCGAWRKLRGSQHDSLRVLRQISG
jgi:hypothetical protein